MTIDERLFALLKDDFVQIVAVPSSACLLAVAYLGALPPLWLSWIWLVFIVSIYAREVGFLAA